MVDDAALVDQVRYLAALLVEILMPPALLHWFVVHPFIRLWRRLGLRVSMVLLFLLLALAGYGMFLVRRPLLASEFGFYWPLAILGLMLYATAIRRERKIRRNLKGRILVGVPEIEGDGEGSPLLTAGVYARSRNPRYLNVMLIMAAFALMTNYLFVWVTAGLTPIAIYLIVCLEEKELLGRYGDDYRDYCAKVPRFF